MTLGNMRRNGVRQWVSLDLSPNFRPSGIAGIVPYCDDGYRASNESLAFRRHRFGYWSDYLHGLLAIYACVTAANAGTTIPRIIRSLVG